MKSYSEKQFEEENLEPGLQIQGYCVKLSNNALEKAASTTAGEESQVECLSKEEFNFTFDVFHFSHQPKLKA